MIIHSDLQYANTAARPLLLNLYLPAVPVPGGQGFPVVVWVSGGGWQRGDRREPHGPFLTDRGYALASIDYRTSAEAIWPAQIHDCRAAVRWLRDHAGEYGLDANRIGAWGPSAGGHLVAMLAVTGHVSRLQGEQSHGDQSSAIAAACDWCGPTDLTRLHDPGWRVPRTQKLHEVVEALLGGSPEQRPIQARDASPLLHVNPTCPPIFIMHGLADDIVTPEHSKVFHDALIRQGVDSTLCLLKDLKHSLYSAERADITRLFFDRTLKSHER